MGRTEEGNLGQKSNRNMCPIQEDKGEVVGLVINLPSGNHGIDVCVCVSVCLSVCGPWTFRDLLDT